MTHKPVLRILGIRGVPAAHGGFETFAEHLALHLVAHGWRVVVYCQTEGEGATYEDTWQGIERINVPIPGDGPASTIKFDWKATRMASQHTDLCLTLGYNTAIFCTLLRARGVPNVINMDGIEWSRAKWGPLAKTWFWLNDWAGCWLGNHLVADHPEIKRHLSSRVRADKITTIAYGAERVTAAPADLLKPFGLEPGRFLTVIARPEPENSLLEIVTGFSRKQRGMPLVVLGRYDQNNSFHRSVVQAASDEVKFVGAIYDKPVVQALRFHSAAYVHGHQVGGTNPSLVEALGAGNAVIAHDNRFNRWVAGKGAAYFSGADEFAAVMDQLTEPQLAELRLGAMRRFEDGLTWAHILGEYETLLRKFLPGNRSALAPDDVAVKRQPLD